MKSVKSQLIRLLKFDSNSSLSHLSAASGLIKVNDVFVVVADDELAIGLFTENPSHSDSVLPLVTGDLPSDFNERKKLKPDWESLVKFDSLNSILVAPSGSKENRQFGVLVNLASKAKVEINFSEVFNFLNSKVNNLNIEGSFIRQNKFCLLQRGNGLNSKNAIIEFDLKGFLQDLKNQKISPNSFLNINYFDLGKINNAKLSFTDACVINDEEVWFLAAAETGDSTYFDGEYKGAIIGKIQSNNEISIVYSLDSQFKPEGLWIEKVNDQYIGYFVTDADDPNKIAGLYKFAIDVF